MASLSRIRIHPIKALDAVDVGEVAISAAGGLSGDRTYAIVDADGEYVNGKRTADVHRLAADVDPASGTVAIGHRGAERQVFDLDEERDALAGWLSAYLGYEVAIESGVGGELTDSSVLGGDPPGATVVSTATLETVASWFPDVDVDGVRRRFRANLEVDGVEPFWEDGLVGDDDGTTFRIGAATVHAVEPVPRCVVPTRDPDTGEATDGFRERFLRKRAETFPDAADRAAFDHLYALTVLAQPDERAQGTEIAVGDRVAVPAATEP